MSSMSKPATAFAPAERKGKMISWESIHSIPTPTAIATVFPTVIRTVGAFTTLSVSLIPQNVTRGAITMERVRGNIEVYFSSTELAAALDNWPVHMSMQLSPIRGNTIPAASVLSPMNPTDQESNRIIWQRQYYPRAGTTITSPGALEIHESNYVGLEVDIKVKRRWDRALWALQLVVELETNANLLHLTCGALRALFRAGDGV